MTFGDDERGQAIQIGAVLLFAALIIAFSSYQAFVIPSQNKEVEFNHNQRVQGDLQELRSAIDAAAAGDTSRSVAVQLGTTFPSRAVFLNPPNPGGKLTLTPYADGVEIENLESKDSNGYWSGGTRSYTTSILTYSPIYSEYQRAPNAVYEQTLLYNSLPNDGDSVVMSPQRLIDGTTINLITVRGDFSTTRSGSYSVDLSTVSSASTTLAVSDSGDPIKITVPTKNPGVWSSDNAIGSTFGTGEPNAQVITENEDSVVIELQSGTTYDLRMGSAAVGKAATASTEAAYIVQHGDATPEAGTRVSAQVRDEFNNPYGRTSVSIDGCGVTTTKTSNDDGTVSVDCQTGEQVEFSIGSEPYETVTVGDPRGTPTVQNVQFERREWTQGSLFGTSTYSQYVLEYGVDPGSNTEIDRIALDLRDSGGNLVTATTQIPADPTGVDSRWTSPTFNNDYLAGNPDDYSATITVHTEDGRTISGEIDVGGSFEGGGGGGDGGGTMASRISYTGSRTTSGSTVTFDLENTGGSESVITGIAVDSTTRPNVDYVENPDGDTFSGAGGAFSDQIDINGATESLDTDATISSSTTETFTLGEFRQSNGQTRGMSGEDIDITVTFDDGSTLQLTI